MTNKKINLNKRDQSVSTPLFQKLAAARYVCGQRAPYMLPAIMKLVPVVQKSGPQSVPTLGVDARLRLYINESFAAKLSHEELATILIHEVLHVLFKHFRRADALQIKSHEDRLNWNLAGDCAINTVLKDMGMAFPQWKSILEDGEELPEGKTPDSLVGVFPSDFNLEDGKLTEYYYAEITKQASEQQANKSAGDGSDGSGMRAKAKGVMSGECGEAAGNPGGYEHPTDGSTGPDGDQVHPGRSEADVDVTAQQVAQNVSTEAQKGHGNIPAGLKLWADEVLKPPKIRWQQKLKDVINRSVTWVAGQKQTKWSRYSRRQAGVGFGFGKPVIPKQISPVPNVAVIGDTSGSMGKEELSRVLAETAEIAKQVRGSITFMAADCTTQQPKQVKRPKEIAEMLSGGGGTSFIPPLKFFEQEATPKPDIVVYITDGGGDAPVLPPKGIKVIWVLVGPWKTRPCRADDFSRPINWGDFIEVDDD